MSQRVGMKSTRLLRKLLLLSSREWADLLRAQMHILRAAWKVRVLRTGDLTQRALANPISVPAHSQLPVARPEHTRVNELVTAMERVADRGICRPLCLVRSIALRNLLASQNIEGSIVRVGVRRDEQGLLAHAWVELDGKIVGDRPSHVRKFSTIDELSVRNVK